MDLDLDKLSPEEILEAIRLKELIKRDEDETKLYRYAPYEKQKDFHFSQSRERLLMAGNQLGKTYSAAYEAAMHLTGEYPDWWNGAVFDEPTVGWGASLTSQSTRDTVQRLLLGQPGAWGTGTIPKELIVEIKRSAHGVADSVESIMVRHKPTGGVSRVTIKTYDQGRERWQGETLDWVWLDEEPPITLYTEALTRTNATGGIVWLTFTPLLGMSDVVRRFLVEKSPGTSVTSMTIYDVDHYSDEKRAEIIASYPAHEREARSKGIPTLGSGRVFPIVEEVISEKAVSIPKHWPRICGIDFGWDHPTAAVWLAWDRDTDTVHVYDCYRVKEATPLIHASAIKAKGQWIPVAWPHDGLQHDKGSGVQLAEQYRNHGINMLKDRATFDDGSNSVEAGLMDMLDRMQTGRFKVARHLHDWWEEFRLYHRKDGKLVKEGDDLMSATRYGMMMLRKATVPKVKEEVSIPGFRPHDSEFAY